MCAIKNFSFLTTVLSVMIATVFCDIGDYDEAVRRGNNYVDKLLYDVVQEHSSEYDPYFLEDSVISFQKKIVFVNVTGEAKLHSGFIRGLSTLSRADGCHLKEEGSRLKIHADLGAGVLDMEYSGTAKFMSVGPTITVHGEVGYVEVTMKCSCNADDGRGGHVDEFYIDNIKGMKVWITGLGPLNWAVNTMIKAVTVVFRGYIHSLIEKQIESYAAGKIPDYQFPVDGVDVNQSTKEGSLVTAAQTEEPPVEESESPIEGREFPIKNSSS